MRREYGWSRSKSLCMDLLFPRMTDDGCMDSLSTLFERVPFCGMKEWFWMSVIWGMDEERGNHQL